MVQIDNSAEYKSEVHTFVVEFAQKHTARALSDATGINAGTISRGINNGFTDVMHKRLAEWIVEVAQSCKEKEVPYEIEGLDLPLSQALRAALESGEIVEDESGGEEVVDVVEGIEGYEPPIVRPSLDAEVFGDSAESAEARDNAEKVSSVTEDSETANTGDIGESGDMDADVEDIQGAPIVGGELLGTESGDLVRCRGCGALWSCGACAPDALPSNVVEIEADDGAVTRYEDIESDEYVLPPGVSVASWRRTEMFQSPWDDPDWFDSELVRTDLRNLFGVQLGDLISKRRAGYADRKEWLMPEVGLKTTEADREFYGESSDVVAEWMHYSTAEMTMREVEGYERNQMYLYAHLRKMQAEVVLIGRFGMTMPGHELPWGDFHRREQLDWRRSEIEELERRVRVSRRSGQPLASARRGGGGLRDKVVNEVFLDENGEEFVKGGVISRITGSMATKIGLRKRS